VKVQLSPLGLASRRQERGFESEATPFSPHSETPARVFSREESIIKGQIAVAQHFTNCYGLSLGLAQLGGCPSFLATNLPLLLLKVANLKVNELKQVQEGKNVYNMGRFEEYFGSTYFQHIKKELADLFSSYDRQRNRQPGTFLTDNEVFNYFLMTVG
jgi:hypothetical protein